jgi:hypothetical protein
MGGLVCALGGRAHVAQGAIEFSGGWLGRRAERGFGRHRLSAVTLGHVIVGSSAETLAALRDHEQAHVRQYERWGPLFVPAYWLAGVWAGLRGGCAYRDNAFEREARAAEAAAQPGATPADPVS